MNNTNKKDDLNNNINSIDNNQNKKELTKENIKEIIKEEAKEETKEDDLRKIEDYKNNLAMSLLKQIRHLTSSGDIVDETDFEKKISKLARKSK